jgi:hypothetical protein
MATRQPSDDASSKTAIDRIERALSRRLKFTGQPTHGICLHRVYWKGNLRDHMASAAHKGAQLKAALAGGNLGQSHPVLAREAPRPCCNTHHQATHTDNPINNGHNARCIDQAQSLSLLFFDDHFPPHDNDGARAVSYLSGKICVGRGAGDFSKNGRRPVNGVLARLFCTRKLTAQPILHELSVQVLMKIESWHGCTAD